MRYVCYRSGRALDVIDATDQRDAEAKATELHGAGTIAWSAQCDPWSLMLAEETRRRADQAEAECTGIAAHD